MQSPVPGSKTRRHIHVRGVVQGVGFRPFVYKLATSLELTGFVFNSSSGVTIEIEGGDTVVHKLIDSLRLDLPRLAEILELTVSDMAASRGHRLRHPREPAGAWRVRLGVSRYRDL